MAMQSFVHSGALGLLRFFFFFVVEDLGRLGPSATPSPSSYAGSGGLSTTAPEEYSKPLLLRFGG
jgi:hypothetical protein